MNEVPTWAQVIKFLMSDDEIYSAAEIIRWLLTRVGKNELQSALVAPVAHALFARDIRVYGGVHQLCMTHGEHPTQRGFLTTFPELGYNPPSVEELVKAVAMRLKNSSS